MTSFQKAVKYFALTLAICLSISIIGGIFGICSLILGISSNKPLEYMQTYQIFENPRSLDIDISSATLTVKNGETFSDESNVKKLTVEEKNGVLVIKDKNSFFKSSKNLSIIIYVPKNTELEKIDISCGAGTFEAEYISAKKISLEFGAGKSKIDEMHAHTSIEIEGGAGDIEISYGILNNLELNMGVGKIDMKCGIFGNSDIEFGVGDSTLTLLGDDENDYFIKGKRGLGSVTICGKEIENFPKDNIWSDSEKNKNKIEIEAGVGDITISFGKLVQPNS